MSNQLLHYSKNGINFIMHADRADHKYYAKIKTSYGERYFYSKEEYDAYINMKTKLEEQGMSAKEAADAAANRFKKEMNAERDNANKLKDWAVDTVTSKTKSATDRVTKELNAEVDNAKKLADWGTQQYNKAKGTLSAGEDFLKSLLG